MCGLNNSAVAVTTVRSIHRGGESDAGVANPRDEETSRYRHSGKRWLHYNVTSSKPTPANIRERNIAVTSYYNQTAIDSAVEKVHF
jgi:hypothetical protein